MMNFIKTTAFQCAELLVNQYLHVVQYHKFNELLDIIEGFKKNSSIIYFLYIYNKDFYWKPVENNIHYISVGLFWNIGDFLAQSKSKNEDLSQEEFEEIWARILGKMISLCLDNHPEVRLSAFHVFSSILQHHGSLLR